MSKEEKKIVLDDTSIEKFDPTVAELQAIVEKTKGLTAIDLKDKLQLEVVRGSRIELKKKRVEIEKYAKSLRDNATAWSKKVSAKEKELIGIIEPEEERLKAIEAEAEQLIIREARMEKLPARRERLAGIGDGIEVTDEELLELDANGFESYYNKRVADKNQKDKEEADKQQAEREAQVRAEQEAKEKELKEKEKKIEEERLANERERERLEAEKQAREREEKAREEERKKAEEEAKRKEEEKKKAEEEEARKKKEEEEKLAKREEYKKWRAGLGWTEETKSDYKEENNGTEVVLYKKLGTFKIK